MFDKMINMNASYFCHRLSDVISIVQLAGVKYWLFLSCLNTEHQ